MDQGATTRFCARFCGVLENLAQQKSLAPPLPPRCRSCATFCGTPDRGAFEFSRRAARAFLSAVNGIAKHSGHSIFTAQKMHLEAVCLFFRACLGIDAPNIRFGVGIGSSSHGRLPNNYAKQRENQRMALFSLGGSVLSGRGKSHTRHFLSYSSADKRT